VREAEAYFHRRDPSEDPGWIGYFDAAELAGEAAHCFRDLRKPKITQEFVAGAIEQCDPTYVRTLAFVRFVHAASFAQQREPHKAVQVTTEAIGIVGSLKSRRYLRYVHDLCADLADYGTEAEVQAFRDLVSQKYPGVLAG